MADEVKAPETTVQPSDHVSVSADGQIILSPEAEAIMEGQEPPEPEKKEPDKASESEKEPEKKEVAKRKIKHNGVEVEIEPEKEDELISMGFDYTKKTQALAEERNKLTPYLGLVDALQKDPELQRHIAGYLKGDTKKEEPPTSDDPIEQLKYETRQEVLKEVEEKFIKPLQQQNQFLSREQLIERVRTEVQRDPLYAEVHKAIIDYVQELPDSVGKNLYLQLDQDPQSYIDMYNKQRTKIAALKDKAKETTTKEEKPPEPVKRETHAPILESGNKGGAETSDKVLKEKIKDLVKRSRAGDFHATGELLELNAMK